MDPGMAVQRCPHLGQTEEPLQLWGPHMAGQGHVSGGPCSSSDPPSAALPPSSLPGCPEVGSERWPWHAGLGTSPSIKVSLSCPCPGPLPLRWAREGPCSSLPRLLGGPALPGPSLTLMEDRTGECSHTWAGFCHKIMSVSQAPPDSKGNHSQVGFCLRVHSFPYSASAGLPIAYTPPAPRKRGATGPGAVISGVSCLCPFGAGSPQSGRGALRAGGEPLPPTHPGRPDAGFKAQLHFPEVPSRPPAGQVDTSTGRLVTT